ncbi:hypothetical protein M9R32_15835 [Paenisporosarcina quisquiliarum]|uniref:Uncharacterized protein n=1 Tax=Paenisporosarcina quisquiliarum TaxID=365346 RepID=A0A9X3LJQ0_9BACL|nr:hypothetical protein [Paenisporosarcina quisquiliarum]MCZ8538645.1 hypothetical protein [Paenisporosarcina quisquiliarum]
MAKRTKKNDAEQKNKQGFDSSKTDSEFSKEFGSGSANANRAKKEKAKKEKASKNQGEWKGMH